MIPVSRDRQRDDDVKVADGYISLSDFNKMKKGQNSRFNAAMRRLKIKRCFPENFSVSLPL
jgi:hypothetical protein